MPNKKLNLIDYKEFTKEELNSFKDSDYNHYNILSGKVPYNGYNFVFNIERLIHNYPIEECRYSIIMPKSLIDSKSAKEYREKFNVKSFCEDYSEKLRKALSGENNPRYGKKASKETKEKMSKSRLGRKVSKETREKISKANSNPSKETREKIGKAHRGKKLSEETIEKMSKSHLGKKLSKEHVENIRKAQSGENNPFYGKKHSEEAKEKISKANLGNKHSEEAREKISKGHRGKKVSEESKEKMSRAHLGKKHSEEAKEKMRQAKLGKTLSEDHKEKIGKSNSGENNYMYGKFGKDNPQYGLKRSDETKEKIGKAHRGKKISEEAKEKMRQAKLGKKLSKEHIESIRKANTGRKHSKESIEKMRIAKSNPSEETREKLRQANLGKTLSEEHKKKLSEAKLGEKNNRYGTKHTEETLEKMSKSQSNRSEETIERMSIGTTNAILNNRDNHPNKIEVYSKSYNENIYVHKGEIFFLKWLDHINIKYEYECKYFEYIDKNGIKRHYTPDFYLPDFDLYIEVKGNTGAPSREQIDSVINEGKNIIVVRPKHLDRKGYDYDILKTLEYYHCGKLKSYNEILRRKKERVSDYL